MINKLIYKMIRRPYKTTILKFGNKKIKAEIADSFAKQMIGLMYRNSIGANEAMLFPMVIAGRISSSVIMANMNFSIDVVWLDKQKRVVDIAKGLPPSREFLGMKSYAPKESAKYVIELKANAASKLGIKAGQKVEFSL